MNRNSTFISESVLSGDPYASKPCRPCLDDFGRTSEKRAENYSSIRRRSVKKQAVVGHPNEEITPRRLSNQRIKQRKVKFSCSGDNKGEENRHEKSLNTLSFPPDGIIAPVNNGCKPFVDTCKQDEYAHAPNIDAPAFVAVQEINADGCHVSQTGKEGRLEKSCFVRSAAISTPIFTEKDETELFTTARLDAVDEQVAPLEDTRKIPHRITERPTSPLDSTGVQEDPNVSCKDHSESDGGKATVGKNDSVALADQLSKDNEIGVKRSALMNDENTMLAPLRTNTFTVSKRIKQLQGIAPPSSVSPLMDMSKKADTCNENSVVTSSDATLLPLSDDDATAETENSITSKKDDSVELTLDEAEEPIPMQRTSLPLLFLRMWTQLTVALFRFLLRLPFLLTIFTLKVAALSAAAYTVLYVCFADDGIQFQPWVYNAQMLNMPGIC
ncbi:hypothetical protein FisN_3Hu531 [Fistulifera solaris]|uniref:Uncharacterized protein n=1 Tax=Fistulifera solaris TaxID=1519565 RepID=A0A1Z5K3S0_FISSO|nr:hypothetical protein FisN_3Hu531 [Fistulifera solaris]|eukprot:GAX20618.1 hypothetical protein FisN_3Hu531 [Fistulifera solaris]